MNPRTQVGLPPTPDGPPTIITYRREPVRDAVSFPQESLRLPVEAMPDQASIQTAPPPVAYTEFWNIGRDAEHAWPVRWLYQALAIPDWLGVMGWPFSAVGHTKPGSLVTAPAQRGQYAGGWLAAVPRSNINPPTQASLGALASLQAPVVLDVNNAKLG